MIEIKKNDIERFQPDKFPGLLENPAGYRKGTDDYAVTFAVPIGAVDRLKPLMQKAGRPFVVYLVQVATPEQAEALLSAEDAPIAQEMPPDLARAETASAAAIADLLGMSERNVQLMVEKGLLVRLARDQYDMLASFVLLWRQYKELQGGQNKDYNQERVELMRLKRMERERMHAEAMGLLVHAQTYQIARERRNADMKQKLLALAEKTLPARLNLDPEQAVIVKSMVKKLLTEFAGPEAIRGKVAEKKQAVPRKRKGRRKANENA